MNVDESGETLTARCQASADRIAVLREELDAEMSRRDRLVIDLRDQGMHWRDVARAARLSVTQCVTIVNGHPAPE